MDPDKANRTINRVLIEFLHRVQHFVSLLSSCTTNVARCYIRELLVRMNMYNNFWLLGNLNPDELT